MFEICVRRGSLDTCGSLPVLDPAIFLQFSLWNPPKDTPNLLKALYPINRHTIPVSITDSANVLEAKFPLESPLSSFGVYGFGHLSSYLLGLGSCGIHRRPAKILQDLHGAPMDDDCYECPPGILHHDEPQVFFCRAAWRPVQTAQNVHQDNIYMGKLSPAPKQQGAQTLKSRTPGARTYNPTSSPHNPEPHTLSTLLQRRAAVRAVVVGLSNQALPRYQCGGQTRHTSLLPRVEVKALKCQDKNTSSPQRKLKELQYYFR